MDNSTHFIELIKKISYDTIQEQGYVRKFDGVVVSVNSDNTIAEVRIMGYEATLSFSNKSNTLLEIGDSVKIESSSDNLTDAFISEKFGSTKNLAESEIQELIVEYAVNDSPIVPPTQDDPSWHATIIDRPLNRYIWQRTRIVYADKETFSTPVNITGANGDAPPLCNIYGENVFKYDINGQLISAENITLTAEVMGSIISVWQFKDENGNWQIYPTSALNPDISVKTLIVSSSENVFVDDVATIRCTTNLESAQDIVSITKIRDGASGYTVLLSNENVTFAGTILTDPSTAITFVQAYLGITPLATTVSTIENIPTGMSVTIQNNNSQSTQITIEVDETFTSKNGELQIPIVVEGENFIKTFSYSLVLNGEEGIGVDSLIEQYAISDGKEIPPTEESSDWVDTPPDWVVNKYLWHRTKIIYSDATISYTVPYVDSTWEVAQSKTQTFTSQPSNYQVNDLWILSEDLPPYKAGEILVANTASVIFEISHWEKKLSYTDNEYAESLDLIIRDNYSNLVKENNAIRLELESNYTQNDEFQAFQSYITEYTSSEVEFVRTTLGADILGVEQKVDDNQATLTEYFRIEGSKIELGRSDSDTIIQIDNDSMDIVTNGEIVASFDKDRTYSKSGYFEDALTVTDYQWKQQDNGNFSLIYVGG